MSDIQAQLIEVISQNLGVEKGKITLESDFYSDLNASELEVADLILACQHKLNLSLDEEAVNEIHTVADIVKLFEEKTDEI